MLLFLFIAVRSVELWYVAYLLLAIKWKITFKLKIENKHGISSNREIACVFLEKLILHEINDIVNC